MSKVISAVRVNQAGGLNVGTRTASDAQWEYLTSMNQQVASTATPQFSKVGVNQAAGTEAVEVNGNVKCTDIKPTGDIHLLPDRSIVCTATDNNQNLYVAATPGTYVGNALLFQNVTNGKFAMTIHFPPSGGTAEGGRIGINQVYGTEALEVGGNIKASTVLLDPVNQSTLISQAVPANFSSWVHNTIYGRGAGRDLAGHANTMIGHEAGITATGGYNVFIGYGSGVAPSVLNSNNSVAVGMGAKASTCGVSLGTSAGQGLTSGEYNAFMGFNAGHTCTTGTWNTTVGTNSDTAAADTTNAIAIGTGAVAASNQCVLGSSSITGTRLFGNVGINQTPGTDTLEVNGSVKSTGTFTVLHGSTVGATANHLGFNTSGIYHGADTERRTVGSFTSAFQSNFSANTASVTIRWVRQGNHISICVPNIMVTVTTPGVGGYISSVSNQCSLPDVEYTTMLLGYDTIGGGPPTPLPTQIGIRVASGTMQFGTWATAGTLTAFEAAVSGDIGVKGGESATHQEAELLVFSSPFTSGQFPLTFVGGLWATWNPPPVWEYQVIESTVYLAVPTYLATSNTSAYGETIQLSGITGKRPADDVSLALTVTSGTSQSGYIFIPHNPQSPIVVGTRGGSFGNGVMAGIGSATLGCQRVSYTLY